MANKQNQKGGDNSTNVQTENFVMQVGIDEKRAREVFQEMNLQLRREYAQEALEIANDRVREFENSLMPKMEQVEGALQAFADPSFQLLVVEAQKAAASTERPADYDLLSELLVHRFRKGDNRIARAGIGLAVEIVDKISDDALLGLTVAHTVGGFLPMTGDPHQGLDLLDKLFGKIFYGELPIGQEWLDHLDVLNAVRVSTFGQLKKVKDYYSKVLSGYIDVGIESGSEDHAKAIEILKSHSLSPDLLTKHSFNSSFFRIPVLNRENIDLMSFKKKNIFEGKEVVVTSTISQDQKDAIYSVYDLYSKDVTLRNQNIEAFMIEWDKRPNLKKLKEWWDNIPISLSITSAGKVLAHSNAQRCDNSLPPLD